MGNDILTVKELAEYLKVAQKTVYKYAVNNEIPAFKVGKSWRFKKVDIDLWIEENQRKNNAVK